MLAPRPSPCFRCGRYSKKGRSAPFYRGVLVSEKTAERVLSGHKAEGGAASTAIDALFVAVLGCVEAGGGDAFPGLADAACAICGDLAGAACVGDGRAHGAAHIDDGLFTVQDDIGAGWRLTDLDEGHHWIGRDAGCRVAIDFPAACGAWGAGFAVGIASAAIDIGFEVVFDAIHAGIRRAAIGDGIDGDERLVDPGFGAEGACGAIIAADETADALAIAVAFVVVSACKAYVLVDVNGLAVLTGVEGAGVAVVIAIGFILHLNGIA